MSDEQNQNTGEETPPVAAEVLDTAIDVDELFKPAVVEEAAVVEKIEEEAPSFVHKKTATQTRPTSIESGGSVITIAIPPDSNLGIEEAVKHIGSMGEATPKYVDWAVAFKDAISLNKLDDDLVKRVESEDTHFVQEISFNGHQLFGRRPTLKKKPGTHEVDSEAALIHLVSHLGIGGLFRAPMWNSGFWVTYKPASEDEMLELSRVITSDKIALGRNSYGLSLSNSISYTLDRVLNFITAHVVKTSVSNTEMPVTDILKYLAPQDVDSFIWGFLVSQYPSGYKYRTPCVNNPKECTHIFERVLNVSKLQWADESIVTPAMRQHMFSSWASDTKTLESVKRYQEEFILSNKKRIIFNEGSGHEIAVTYKTPSVSEWIERGHFWIGSIVEAVNATMGLDEDIGKRNEMISSRSKAAALCQYIHWVDSIEIGELSTASATSDEPAVVKISELSAVRRTLSELSSVDSIREKIVEELFRYINKATVSIIGVPVHSCPVCNAPQENENQAELLPRHTSVVPLDVLQLFFALLGQRLEQISSRPDL